MNAVTQKRTVIAFVLLLAALPVACTSIGDAVTPTGEENPLLATEWVLISLDGKALLEGTHIELGFEDGWISGFGGCNAYGGGPDSGGYVATEEGSLTFPQIAITAMECQSPKGVMEQENAYVQALRQVETYRIMEDRLEAQDAAGRMILVYARQEQVDMDPGDLPGTAWQLVSINGTNPVAGSFITLVFQNAHRLGGHAGCRDYVSVYEAEGGDLGLSYTAMLGPVCAEEALLEREGAYTTSLGWVTHYRLNQGQLELLTTRGETLLFERLPEEAMAALEGPTWSLLAFVEPNPVNDMPAPLPLPTEPLSGSEITANFEDGTAQGSTGCNTYRTPYTRDGNALTLEDISFTEMACLSPEGVMGQEQRYLGVLKDVIGFHVYGGQLWLETEDGRALVFSVKASQR